MVLVTIGGKTLYIATFVIIEILQFLNIKMLKQKILNFIKHISFKIYLKLDNRHSKIYNEYVKERVMAEFHY
ncbi:unnamed protein product [marine sediment metagenome]|uniref:Uncharacterized protein n=1 Tax=marine sediment metagenome TaxID=412755 RepID=X1SBX5_9ZZZZ